jgi:hypothetical protein
MDDSTTFITQAGDFAGLGDLYVNPSVGEVEPGRQVAALGEFLRFARR